MHARGTQCNSAIIMHDYDSLLTANDNLITVVVT